MYNWTKTFSVIIVVDGALMIAVAVVADSIGLGRLGFSLKQLLLVLVAAAMLLIDLALGLAGKTLFTISVLDTSS